MIRVDIHFDCGGCAAKETASSQVRNTFTSFSGRSYGFGTRRIEPGMPEMIEQATPDGWVAFDPYTQCTYCPKCWESIEGGEGE